MVHGQIIRYVDTNNNDNLVVNDDDVISITCVVWMMVRSFIRETPGPMEALKPAVPNSILAPKQD